MCDYKKMVEKLKASPKFNKIGDKYTKNLTDDIWLKLFKFGFTQDQILNVANKKSSRNTLKAIAKYYKTLTSNYEFTNVQILKIASHCGGGLNIEAVIIYAPNLKSKYKLTNKQIVKVASHDGGSKNIKAINKHFSTLTSESDRYNFSLDDIIRIVSKPVGNLNIKAVLNHTSELKKDFGFTNRDIVKIAGQISGHISIKSVLENAAKLQKDFKLKNDAIVRIVGHSCGANNIDAFINYAQILTTQLGNCKFSIDEIIKVVGQRCGSISLKLIADELKLVCQTIAKSKDDCDELHKLILKLTVKNYKDIKNKIIDLYNKIQSKSNTNKQSNNCPKNDNNNLSGTEGNQIINDSNVPNNLNQTMLFDISSEHFFTANTDATDLYLNSDFTESFLELTNIENFSDNNNNGTFAADFMQNDANINIGTQGSYHTNDLPNLYINDNNKPQINNEISSVYSASTYANGYSCNENQLLLKNNSKLQFRDSNTNYTSTMKRNHQGKQDIVKKKKLNHGQSTNSNTTINMINIDNSSINSPRSSTDNYTTRTSNQKQVVMNKSIPNQSDTHTTLNLNPHLKTLREDEYDMADILTATSIDNNCESLGYIIENSSQLKELSTKYKNASIINNSFNSINNFNGNNTPSSRNKNASNNSSAATTLSNYNNAKTNINRFFSLNRNNDNGENIIRLDSLDETNSLECPNVNFAKSNKTNHN